MKRIPVSLRVGLAGLLVFLAMSGLVRVAYAAEYIPGDTIPTGKVIDDDVFITGDNVTVDGTVNGDLFAAGSNIIINGTVKGSLFAAGQMVNLNGTVEGSVYSVGRSVIFGDKAHIGRNTYAAAYNLETKQGSNVGHDIWYAGYQGILAGTVERSIHVAANALEFSGVVNGDLVTEINEPGAAAPNMSFSSGMPRAIPSGLRVAKGATIGGQLIYTSPVNQVDSIQAQPVGGVVYQTPQPNVKQQQQEKRNASGMWKLIQWGLSRVREFVTLLVLGALALWLLPEWLNRAADQARSATLPAAGWGFVSIVVVYAGAFFVALLILAFTVLLGIVTLGGLAGTLIGVGFSSLGLALAVFGLMVGYGSKMVVAYFVGKLILQKLAPKASQNPVLPYLLGVVLYVLLRSIPILGWIIGVIVTLIGVGAIWLVVRGLRNHPTSLTPAEAQAA